MGEVINQLRLSFFAWLSSRTVIQELGREEILPFSSFFASNRPFNAPLAGIFTEYLVTCIYLISVPPGDAYIFLINSKSSISGLDAFKLRFGQWYLMGGLLFIPWFHLACSSYTYRHIEFGTGILLFEHRNLSFLYISCLTFFWWLCLSFHRLQGHTRNFRTGYVIYLFIQSFAYVVFKHDSFHSRTQSAASLSYSLASHTGIHGVFGFQKGMDIFFSVNGLMEMTVSLDTHSAECLGLWYHTLVEHRYEHALSNTRPVI